MGTLRRTSDRKHTHRQNDQSEAHYGKRSDGVNDEPDGRLNQKMIAAQDFRHEK